MDGRVCWLWWCVGGNGGGGTTHSCLALPCSLGLRPPSLSYRSQGRHTGALSLLEAVSVNTCTSCFSIRLLTLCPMLPPPLSVCPNRGALPLHVQQIFAHLDAGKDELVDYVDWISRISVLDTAAIASRCRSRGPFAGIARPAGWARAARHVTAGRMGKRCPAGLSCAHACLVCGM